MREPGRALGEDLETWTDGLTDTQVWNAAHPIMPGLGREAVAWLSLVFSKPVRSKNWAFVGARAFSPLLPCVYPLLEYCAIRFLVTLSSLPRGWMMMDGQRDPAQRAAACWPGSKWTPERSESKAEVPWNMQKLKPRSLLTRPVAGRPASWQASLASVTLPR